jgi:hypothetical protein
MPSFAFPYKLKVNLSLPLRTPQESLDRSPALSSPRDSETCRPQSDHVERSDLAKRFLIAGWERQRAKRGGGGRCLNTPHWDSAWSDWLESYGSCWLEIRAEGEFKLDLSQDRDPGKQKLKGAVRTETYQRRYCQQYSPHLFMLALTQDLAEWQYPQAPLLQYVDDLLFCGPMWSLSFHEPLSPY